MRCRPTQRFIDQVSSDSPEMRKRVFRALKRLDKNPWSKGVNLEPFRGRAGFFTARITRNYRFLLRDRGTDEKGERVFDINEYASHNDTYGR